MDELKHKTQDANHKTHILFVIAGISAGTGTFCKALGQGLRQQFGDEFTVSLLTFRPDALLPENASCFDRAFTLSRGVHADWRRMFELPTSILRLRRATSRIQPDLIFTIGTFSNVVASLAIHDRPVVLSEHLNMSMRLAGARFGRLTAWWMRRAYRKRLMVVASQELADDLKAHFNARRTAVIPNGIDAEIVRQRAAAEAALPAEKYFISVGRLTEQKDVATALRAFAAARAAGLQEHLVIAGDGELRQSLEALAGELKIDQSTHFLGHVANPYPLIAKASALVLSSIWEGFAYVPIEAMALGVPVIATSCPSGPVEILGNGAFGLLAPPRDPRRLAQCMLALSENSARREHFARQALIRAEQLCIGHMTSGYHALFAAESARRP